jgi:transposase
MVSPDLKRAAVRMSRAFSIPVVAVLLGVSDDTIRRAIKQYEATGDVVALPSGKKRGRKPKLDEDDRKASDFFCGATRC